jgi:hypothetical protein
MPWRGYIGNDLLLGTLATWAMTLVIKGEHRDTQAITPLDRTPRPTTAPTMS